MPVSSRRIGACPLPIRQTTNPPAATPGNGALPSPRGSPPAIPSLIRAGPNSTPVCSKTGAHPSRLFPLHVLPQPWRDWVAESAVAFDRRTGGLCGAGRAGRRGRSLRRRRGGAGHARLGRAAGPVAGADRRLVQRQVAGAGLRSAICSPRSRVSRPQAKPAAFPGRSSPTSRWTPLPRPSPPTRAASCCGATSPHRGWPSSPAAPGRKHGPPTRFPSPMPGQRGSSRGFPSASWPRCSTTRCRRCSSRPTMAWAARSSRWLARPSALLPAGRAQARAR